MSSNAMVSMTGYATRRGQGAGHAWVWDLRSVNGKGLDLRLRLPDWVEGLEPALRTALTAGVIRGNVTLSLKLARETGKLARETGGEAAGEAMRLNPAALSAALSALAAVTETAARSGIELAAPAATDVLAMRGVLDQGGGEEDTAPLLAALLRDFAPLLADFNDMRRTEGAALARVVADQIDRIESLAQDARAAAEARRPLVEAALRENLARVLAGAAEADPARVAQELAMLAVKADVTEELDRLAAHVAAARGLLAEEGAVGRKLDFLMQEFMREANTLCSKAGNAALTAIGLDLKHVIDQMREQIQNVE